VKRRTNTVSLPGVNIEVPRWASVPLPITDIDKALCELKSRWQLAGVRVRLSMPIERKRDMLAEVTARMSGDVYRAQALTDVSEIACRTAERLDDNLSGAARNKSDCGSELGERLFATKTENCPIVRRKIFHLHAYDKEKAIETAVRMDYRVHLFRDVDSGEDAIICREGGPNFVLMVQGSQATYPALPGGRSCVWWAGPLLLTELDAVSRLCRFGMPFLFFTDPASGRGRLLYRRYDRNLGLIIGL
jgi:hypothetical protein